jgi:WD40 repeat protein
MIRWLAVVLLVGVALIVGDRCQAQEPKLWATLKGHTGGVYCVVFSTDNRMVASVSYDQTIKLWEVATGKVRTTLQGHFLVYSVAFSPDGKTLASVSWETVTSASVNTSKRGGFEVQDEGQKEPQSDSQQRWGKAIFIICVIITFLLALSVSPIGFILAVWFNGR